VEPAGRPGARTTYDDDVTPEDLTTIDHDVAVIEAHRDRFTSEFYATLFEIDPELRRLFPHDMDGQQRKLFDELAVLIERGTGIRDTESRDHFVARSRDLGERHEVYGVEPRMYELVGVALTAALREVGVDADHIEAWDRLYRLVSSSMLDRSAAPR
jgi:hemoglobin-like flavoprotein